VRAVPAANLILAAVLVVALGILGRRPVVEALRETRAGVVRYLREAGWADLVALAAIVGVGVWLRLHFLDNPMRWDESYSFLAYGIRPLGQVTTIYDSVNNHVFSNLLMHISYTFFGSGFKVIRGPVLLAGVLLPLAAYVASLRIYGRPAALITAALVATSSELVDYSTNARGYMIASLAVVSALALTPSLLRSRNPTYWGLFSLICALGFYTIPVFIYPFAVLVAGLALAGLLRQSTLSRGRFIASLAIATFATLAFTALLYGPILDDMLRLTFDVAGSLGIDERLAILLPLAVALAVAIALTLRSASWGPNGARVTAPVILVAGVVALALLSHHTASNIDQHLHIYKQLWRLWTLALPEVAKWVLVLGFAAAAASVVRRGKAAFPLAAALLSVVVGLIATNTGLRGADATRFWLPLLPLVLIAAVGGLLSWEPIRKALAGRPANLVVGLGAVAVAVSLAVVVSRDDLANQHPSSLPSAPSIASLVGPRLMPADRLVGTTCDQPIQAYALYADGWSQLAVVASVTPQQAAHGRMYFVVDHECDETLRSVLAQTAPGTGLRAKEGRKLKSFPDATVYEIAPVRPAARSS
jgi:Dolichyl-phosphate-mannose-protein mannosyltransferase